jgi:hypothetical protein
MRKVASARYCLPQLLTALIEGAFEVPLWKTFLEAVIAETNADYATLILHPPGRPMDDGLRLAAGGPEAQTIAAALRAFFYSSDAPRRAMVPEGGVVSLTDLRPLGKGLAADTYAELVGRHRVSESLQVRVVEPHGVEAWLSIVWCRDGAPSAHAPLLSALAAPLRGVVRSHVMSEKGRLSSSISRDTSSHPTRMATRCFRTADQYLAALPADWSSARPRSSAR